jgi:hypothetical protein
MPFVVHATSTTKEEAMKYMLFIYAGDDTEWESLSEEEQRAIYAEYGALSAEPVVRSDHQLQPSGAATTVRVDGGQALTTDGPFVETKEELGGYYLIEVDDLDAALAFAARIPAARRGGAVEIRPIVER